MTKASFSNIRKNILDNLKQGSGTLIKDSFGATTSVSEFNQYVSSVINNLASCTKRVVVITEKNAYTYATILSLVFSGRTWVPISESLPPHGILEIIQSCTPDLILMSRKFSESIKDKADFSDFTISILEDLISSEILLPIDWPAVDDDHTAIVYHTSGSTGKPKGVEISISNLSAALNNTVNIYSKQSLTWGDYHDLSFVISINIFFSCLYANGKIFCANSKLDQISPVKSILDHQVQCLVTVPSTLNRISVDKNFKKIFTVLDVVVSCGEPLSLNLLSKYLQQKRVKIYNFYGSTELSTWVFYHECKKEDLETFSKFGYAPLGQVIDGNKFCFSDTNILLISGPQVCKGYLNAKTDSHITRARNEDWFSTGDVAEIYNGRVICKGRFDQQLKINGYRIHPLEIENKISDFEGIDGAVCFEQQLSGKKILACGCISSETLSKKLLVEFLKKKLPTYMIPTRFYLVKEKPINKNGKIDKLKLRQIITDRCVLH